MPSGMPGFVRPHLRTAALLSIRTYYAALVSELRSGEGNKGGKRGSGGWRAASEACARTGGEGDPERGATLYERARSRVALPASGDPPPSRGAEAATRPTRAHAHTHTRSPADDVFPVNVSGVNLVSIVPPSQVLLLWVGTAHHSKCSFVLMFVFGSGRFSNGKHRRGGTKRERESYRQIAWFVAKRKKESKERRKKKQGK